MNVEDFPKEITKDNLDNLMKKADTINRKANQFKYRFGYAVSYLVLGLLALFLLLYLASIIVSTYLPGLSGLAFIIFVPSVISIWSFPTLSLILDLISWFQRRYFGYPKYEEEFFAKCFIIAKHIMSNERIKAMKKTEDFLSFLDTFLKDRFNPKRKVYAPEINLLVNAEVETSRMVMFSKNNIEKLMMKLGLAFVRNDDPNAFSYFKQLVNEVQDFEYRKPKGRIRSFLTEVEAYPNFFKLLFSIVVFVVPIILAILSG